MLVSVYVPTRNRVELLQRAVQSVLLQSHSDVQIIVVDDGSTDGTPDYLNDIAARDRRVVALRNDAPVGAPASRNRAIRRAEGDFVTGLDDDDYFDADRIRSFVSAWSELSARETALGGLYSQSLMIDEDRTTLSARPPKTDFRQLFAQNTVGNQLFAPKRHFVEAGLFDEQLPAWQDLDTFIRILFRFGPAYLVDRPTYFHDDTGERDRISAKSQRIRQAMERISGKYDFADRDLRFALFMQMFNGYYDIAPTWNDIMHVATSRPSAAQVTRIARRLVRSYLIRKPRHG